MESDDEVPVVREDGERTQLGFWVILRLAYMGLCELSALWHSLGVYAPRSCLTPVGTLLISSLAHLTLGRDVMVGLGVKTDRYSITSDSMSGVRAWSWCEVVCGLAVNTRLPFPVHFAADRNIDLWPRLCNRSLIFSQRSVADGRSSFGMGDLLMSTIRLGLAGVVALAANVGGADVSFCPVTWAEGATLGGGVGSLGAGAPLDCSPVTALDSICRVLFMSVSSALS
jgi:hypothetical protein